MSEQNPEQAALLTAREKAAYERGRAEQRDADARLLDEMYDSTQERPARGRSTGRSYPIPATTGYNEGLRDGLDYAAQSVLAGFDVRQAAEQVTAETEPAP